MISGCDMFGSLYEFCADWIYSHGFELWTIFNPYDKAKMTVSMYRHNSNDLTKRPGPNERVLLIERISGHRQINCAWAKYQDVDTLEKIQDSPEWEIISNVHQFGSFLYDGDNFDYNHDQNHWLSRNYHWLFNNLIPSERSKFEQKHHNTSFRDVAVQRALSSRGLRGHRSHSGLYVNKSHF
jgi:hypothetical protein